MKLGIFNGFHGGLDSYELYIKACQGLNVDYEVVDILSSKWMDNVRKSDCDGFLVRPSCHYDVWKRMFDERLYFIERKLNKLIYPTYDELFMYENKRLMAYFLESHGIPCPKTHVFYDRDEALTFLENAAYPVVFKTHIGATATGVEILKTKRQAERLIKRVFSIGYGRKIRVSLKGLLKHKIMVPGCNPAYYLEREYKVALLQQYLPNVSEWRMIRIGDSYFGYQKLKHGEFHSGGHLDGWFDPPDSLLMFTKKVCDLGEFTSMALDVFEPQGGEYYVNELQCVWGSYNPSQMYINGKPGRYRYNQTRCDWVFEEGLFNQNGSCNLRVEHFLEIINKRRKGQINDGGVIEDAESRQ
jgi:glutathione synthase/RimK-type ligase-like ATP-grasp enzyme